MKQDENGRSLESKALARREESPLELVELDELRGRGLAEVDETDPSFPARWGERAPASTRGSLNVSGAPRIDRTNPNFLAGEIVANLEPEEPSVEISPPSEEPESKIVPPSPHLPHLPHLKPAAPKSSAPKQPAQSPKDAVTQDMPAALAREEAIRTAQRELDSNLLLAGIAPALAPDESGFRQRVKEEESRPSRSETNDSIDELIDGLPFEAPLPRRKSERRRQKDEAARPRRDPLPSLTGQGPIHTGTGDVQEALRAAAKSKPPRTGSLVPAGLARSGTPLLGGLLVLAVLLLGAFFVARSTQTGAPKAPPVAAAPSAPAPAPTTAPAAAPAATVHAATGVVTSASAASDDSPQSVTSPSVVTPAAPDPNGSTKASLPVRPRPAGVRARPHTDDALGLEANPLDDSPRPSSKVKPSAPTPAPSASPSPSAEDKLLTGH